MPSLEPLALQLPSRAHASDNKRVYTRRRWSTSPSPCFQRVYVFVRVYEGGCLCECTCVRGCLFERVSRVRMHRHARTYERTRGETTTSATTNVTSWHTSRIYHAASFQGHAIKMRARSQGTSHASTRQTFACPYQLVSLIEDRFLSSYACQFISYLFFLFFFFFYFLFLSARTLNDAFRINSFR